MVKWLLIATCIVAITIFFNSEKNRAAFLDLVKRFWKSVAIAAVIVGALTYYMLVNSQ